MNKIILSAVLLLSVNSFADVQSIKTSVKAKNCITSSPTEEIDSFTMECPAMGGYKVIVSGGDLRYSLKLISEGTTIETTGFSGFHDVTSKKIEWRYNAVSADGDLKVKYTALIYKLEVANYDEVTGDIANQETMVVVRLDGAKSCVIGSIAPLKDEDATKAAARKLADDMTAKCIAL